MTDPILEHLKRVEKRVRSMHDRGAIAFGLACGERLATIYERSVRDVDWGDTRSLRAALEAGWRYVVAGGSLPPGLGRECANARPPGDVASALAFTASNALADFFEVVENDEPEYAYLMADRAFDLLDVLVDERPSVPEVDAALQKEVRRQEDDLDRLARKDWLSMVSDVRSDAQAADLFDGLWPYED